MAEKKEEQKPKKTRWWVTLLVGIGLVCLRFLGLGGYGEIATGIGLIVILYVPYEIYKNSKIK